MSKDTQWVLIALVLYVGVGYALWYYNRAQAVVFPVAYPSKFKFALTWPTYQFSK